MKAFEYASPTSVDDALKHLTDSPSAEALSGGTDLISRMKDYVTSPARVVYLKDVKSLAGIAERPLGLEIGAGTRLVDVVANPLVAERYPALRQATLEVGTPQIRNMATVGGNLMQRPRCWYFRGGFGLLGRKDGKSLVRAGDNRYHAIFLTEGDALFVSPSSLAAPLVALGAQATILGPKGERTIPVEDLYRVPKSNEDRELTTAPGELLLKVSLPAAGKNGSYEVRQKQSHDWPLVMAAVNLKMDGDKVGDCRVVLYGVAPIPWRSAAAEKSIRGQVVSRDSAAAAAVAAAEGAKPLSMNGYKVALVRTAVKRALLVATGDRYWEEV
ncbi:FAD binding domain-containing protein [Paludisphaera mucosa]|uniref:FAD binding domain-containing protein n=1 Tax=Paludisphaera mucosa TaxID=3030827 RepID=A0ABT6F552_9BACT|nr:FAD binding domain-containing protein [Paludisphaera mucosa]MDG3002621.1 FAD binding domain-containing protein [Paludisphaera mucosa]